jgi:aspartyl-tRNA(Asn)/glutamyl-tRNA(Gln) amidotransferase subunit A
MDAATPPMIQPFTIEEYGRRLRARQISAGEMVDQCLSHIAADNPRLNAFILVMADEARRDAARADRELAGGRDRGPLHGVPVSVKDLIDVRGVATTAASRVREGHVAGGDAATVARLRESGAVIIGKTNLHEFAFGTTNEDSAFGPARHPADPTRSPGGSSGGSAVSVAAGMALASLATDTGGSIRIPAAACGIVGLKPGYGEISLDGVVPLSRSLDHAGPLSATVRDAWIMYRALLGRVEERVMPVASLKGMRFGVPRAYFLDLIDDGVRGRFDHAVDELRRAGAVVDEVAIEHAALTPAIYTHITFPEAAALHARTLDTMGDRYTPPVRHRLETARYVLAEDYVRALAGRDVLRDEVDRALTDRAALILPTLAIPAPPLGASTVDVGGRHESVRALTLRLTQLFNLSGHPAISLPSGRTAAGLPSGLQLVGRHGQTETLLAIAASCERTGIAGQIGRG